MGYRELLTWAAWKREYTQLLARCDDYTEAEIEREIKRICRELEISRDQFEAWQLEVD